MGTWICKGVCINSQYETKKTVCGKLREEYRRCSVCCVFLKYQGIYCPCCGVRLKHSPRNNYARKRYYKAKYSILQ